MQLLSPSAAEGNQTKVKKDPYKSTKEKISLFAQEYWIPISVSADLLHVSTSAAYEWIAAETYPPRRSWVYSLLHGEGQIRRYRTTQAAELYNQKDVTMRDVSRKMGISLFAVRTYLQVAGQPWFSLSKEKHLQFSTQYPDYANRIDQVYKDRTLSS